ncbi:MAG TPA: MMPL family transporter [Steroidobacteraceae bacterium]|nr:MMPL family transporter [Steroidobacteraceae bacterium]
MYVPASAAVVRFFLCVLGLRRWIAAAFLLLTIAGVWGALHVPDDLAIDSLIVANDPDARAARQFERLFPEGDHALLMLEAPDPFAPAAVQAARQLTSKLSALEGVEAQSVLDAYGAPAAASAPPTASLRELAAAGSPLRRAGLVGDHFLSIALELRTRTPADRDRALSAIEAAARPFAAPLGPFTAIRRVGSPWLDAWLERETATAEARAMPLFGVFLMALMLLLYRSWRTLAAMVLTLGAVVAIAVGLAAPFGWTHTVVSALVPLTVLVTSTSTLVYIHSRYIERGESATLIEHHARTLANKFVPCTASIFATAVGFAALAVSNIRPIRQMGLWTACGLVVAWIGCFSLFPALQALLRTPLRAERAPAARWFPGFVTYWVPRTARLRWPLVGAAALLTLCGAVALCGVPGWLAPLPLQTDALTYIDPHVEVARDTRLYEGQAGLAVFELWLQTQPGRALSPDLLHGLQRLSSALERDPRISAVDGPESAVGAAVRAYVDPTGANLRLSIRGRDTAFGGPGTMRAYIERTFRAVQLAEPALRDVRARVVGQSVLAEEVSLQLVPTLVQSFALTASVIFCVFLLVFRSPSARLMAMIPSLFAILVAFLIMRVSGIALNVATILIGSTVLGATENDQVHFFYHFQEGRANGSTPEGLRHALLVAGRPIAFATLVNAAGFLALALSDLPPMREFGIVSASAFLLALAADFTALPAALWILSRAHRQVPSSSIELT